MKVNDFRRNINSSISMAWLVVLTKINYFLGGVICKIMFKFAI